MHGPVPPLSRIRDQSATEGSPRGGDGEAPDGIDALRVLWRRKITVIGVTGMVLLASLVIVLNLKPEYTAATELMLTPAKANDADDENTERNDAAAIASEVRVLRSRGLLRRVVRQRQLLLDPEFNPAVRPPTGLWARIGLVAAPAPEELRIERQRARTVAALDRRLSVQVLGRSRVIEVAVTSSEPEKAARLANAVARGYLAHRREARARSTASNARHLRARAAEAGRRLDEAERKLERFRREADLIGSADVEGFARLKDDRDRARADRVALETKVSGLERRLAKRGHGPLPAGLESPLLDRLREQRADALAQKSALSAQHGPRHPKVLDVGAELEGLRRQARDEARRIVNSLREELRIAQAREHALERALAERRREAVRRLEATAKLSRLQRAAESARERHETVQARLEEASFRSQPPQRVARVISRAAAPAAPQAPRTDLIMALALLAGLPCGIGAAVLMERMDRGIAGLEQLGAATRLVPLAAVPRVPVKRGRARPLAGYDIVKPASVFAESIDRAWTAIQQADVDRPPRAILMTSALPAEGKTTIALALARMLARRGKRVILVEADLRRPGVARALRFAAEPGFAAYLLDRVPFSATLRRDRYTGLHVLPAGSGGSDPGRMLASQRFATTLQALISAYDFVIVDAPPVLPVADARVLAPLVDAVVLVTRWRRTPWKTTALAARELRDAGAVPGGALLAQVDSRQSRLYDTAEQPLHGRAVRAYYAG